MHLLTKGLILKMFMLVFIPRMVVLLMSAFWGFVRMLRMRWSWNHYHNMVRLMVCSIDRIPE